MWVFGTRVAPRERDRALASFLYQVGQRPGAAALAKLARSSRATHAGPEAAMATHATSGDVVARSLSLHSLLQA